MTDTAQESLRQAALFYHENPKPGKLEIRATLLESGGAGRSPPFQTQP